MGILRNMDHARDDDDTHYINHEYMLKKMFWK